MKKIFQWFLCLCCTLPLLVQCASQKAVRSTNVKVYSIDSKVEDIDKQVEKLKTETVKRVQTSQAEAGNRFDNVEAEQLKLKGKLEELAHFNRLLREENKEAAAGLSSSIDELNNAQQKRFVQYSDSLLKLDQRVVQLDAQMKRIEDGLEKINRERAAEAGERARQAAEQARKAAQAAEQARKAAQAVEDAQARAQVVQGDGSVHLTAEKHKKSVTDQQQTTAEDMEPAAVSSKGTQPKGTQLYDEALALYKENKFSRAYDVFSEYLNKFPQEDMAANARFWLGECLYSQKEYELAILDYQKVIVDYPRNSKAPAALLKQGMAFENLKDKETARIVYQKVLDNYPKSDQVAAAQKRLEGLK
jgi:tol-pal system protein YbgF